jgi:hypothetical protein
MRQLRIVFLALCLAGAGCGDVERIAKQAINSISATLNPKAVSQKIQDGFKSFWKSVTSAPRTITQALQQLPSAAQKTVAKVRAAIAGYLSSAAQITAPADSTGCGLVGLTNDGDGYCYDEGGKSYIVFCQGGQPYALDCTTLADDAVCGEIDGVIDCVEAPTTVADEAVMAHVEDAADSGIECGGLQEGDAECEGNYVVFCSGGTVRELDCSTFSDGKEESTCGAPSGAITCGFDE